MVSNIEVIETHKGWVSGRSSLMRASVNEQVHAYGDQYLRVLMEFLANTDRFEVAFNRESDEYLFRTLCTRGPFAGRQQVCPKYNYTMAAINDHVVLDYELQYRVLNNVKALELRVGTEESVIHPHDQLYNMLKAGSKRIFGTMHLSPEFVILMNTKAGPVTADIPPSLRDFLNFLRNDDDVKYVVTYDGKGFIVQRMNSNGVFFIRDGSEHAANRWLFNQLFVPFDMPEEERMGGREDMQGKVDHKAEPPKRPKEEKHCQCGGNCHNHHDKVTEIMAALRTISDVCKEHDARCNSSCPLAVQNSNGTWVCGMMAHAPINYTICSPQEWRAFG